MTSKECNSRDRRIVDNIQMMFRVNQELKNYVAELDVSIENDSIVLRGRLPSGALKAELIPAVRRAGILSQVSNYVRVAA
ncbi:MAG: hypothetical protein ACR2NZ_02770 [Rubripirellula sp.]